jgi:acyl-CoA thioesterase-1
VSLRSGFLLFLGVFLLLAGCGRPSDSERAAPPARTDAAPPAQSTPPANPAPAPADPTAPRVIFLGDSLTAGLGLDPDQSFPAVIQARLTREGYRYTVVNAGVSGDTSAGGLRRLEWAMGEGDPQVLVVALGGNDGLRGLSPEQLEKNLADIIKRAQARKLRVILAGMEAPPNFGEDYTRRFREVYPALATRYKIPLIPFLLEGVAGDPSLNQADGIHPNPRGAQIVADLVWRTLTPALTASRSTNR